MRARAVISIAGFLTAWLAVGCSFDGLGVGLRPDGLIYGEGRDLPPWVDSSGFEDLSADAASDRSGADIADGGAPDVGIPALVSRGLLVRYFIDEAASGDAPSHLEDSAGLATPLRLAVTYDSGSFVEVAGNRGLSWTSTTKWGRAAAPVAGSRIETELHGSTTGTIELVFSAQQVSSNGSRFSHIGSGNDSGWFTLRTGALDRVEFWCCKNTKIGEWAVPFATTSRVVLHLVFDSTQTTDDDRAKVYHDGRLLQPSGGGRLCELGTALDIPSWGHYALGNRESGDRGFAGTIFYAALYSEALSSDEVVGNAARLLVDDDAR